MLTVFRRAFLLATATAAVSAPAARAVVSNAPATAARTTSNPAYPFVVPALPYATSANEPYIDAQTMELHHDKHHAAYVSNLNAAVKDHPQVAALQLTEMLARLNELPEAIRMTVRNNGGGHANHSMFWTVMGGKGGEPTGEVASAIARDFGSFAQLKADFNKAGAAQFGSGWAMVLVDRSGKLSLIAQPNQDTPLLQSKRVLFGNDVWEHAYYLKYQNRRPDYLTAWWNVVNWAAIERRYKAASSGELSL